MMSSLSSRTLMLVTLAAAAAVVACGLTAPAPTPTSAPPTPLPALPATATPPPATSTSAVSPTPEASAASTTPVRVSASGGNMTLRRGPATAYDIRGYFLAGQTTLAVARNAAADWLLVEDPSQTTRTAWVSATSRYIKLEAEAAAIQALPIESVDPPLPAFIRNCTFHPMLIQPAGVLLAEQFDSPNNMRAFNPGVYEAYDQNQEGKPKVLSAELREGKTIDIIKDGLNNTYPCPS